MRGIDADTNVSENSIEVVFPYGAAKKIVKFSVFRIEDDICDFRFGYYVIGRHHVITGVSHHAIA